MTPFSKDKVVIVTGSSKGIGKAIAEKFAANGAKVVLVAREAKGLASTREEFLTRGWTALSIQADVSSEADMERMAREVLDNFGAVDILCHNAGIYQEGRLGALSLAEWKKTIDINLTGTFLAVNACLSSMTQQKRGKVVITSSISGPQTALPGYSHYTASKGGIAGFVRTAAVELAKYNIQVNSVEPGNITSEGFQEMPEEHRQAMLKAIPAGRLGTGGDVAEGVFFLASPGADYITGQSLIIDGGQTLPESHFSHY